MINAWERLLDEQRRAREKVRWNEIPMQGERLDIPTVSEQKHSLDIYATGTGKHVECWLDKGVIIEAEDVAGHIICHTYLEPQQALALLAWLFSEHETLEQLAKEQGVA